jgi:LPPG:FO 2-phospho-L-lactate transferase
VKTTKSVPETYVVLSGGVGGSLFLRGLLDHLSPSEVTAVVNTGDDIEMYGLHISPDVDINLYALTGRIDEERKWGRADESWTVQNTLKADLGLKPWFNLGDRDLAAHLYRTQRLRDGATLCEVTREMAQHLGVACHLMPMSDQRVAIHLLTDQVRCTFRNT